jgi:hypothetical protein
MWAYAFDEKLLSISLHGPSVTKITQHLSFTVVVASAGEFGPQI